MYAKTPTIFQMEMTECGAASLCMVLAYYGCHVPLERMRVESGVSRDGCSLQGVRRAAGVFGLKARGFRRDAAALAETCVPCIIHWNANHFVVFEGFRGKYAYINDPAVGRRRLTQAEFEQGYSGVVMTFEKTEDFKKNKKKQTLTGFAAGRLRGHGAVLLHLLAIGCLMAAPGVVLPLLTKVFIDDVLESHLQNWFVGLLALMGGCLLFRALLGYYRAQVLTRLRAKLTLLSGRDFLARLFSLPASFYDQRYTGDLVGRMLCNAEACRFLTGDLAEAVLDAFEACCYLAVMFACSPMLTLVSMARILVSVLCLTLGMEMLRDASIRLQMSRSKVSSAVMTGLGMTDSLKASGAEAAYTARVLGCQAECAGVEQELAARRRIIRAIPDGAGKLTDLLLLYMGGMMVMRGSMTAGMLAAFMLLLRALCGPVDRMTGFFRSLQEMRAGADRIGDIENHAPDELLAAGRAACGMSGKLRGHVDMKDVAFGYSVLCPPVVEDISVRIGSGELVAFVGDSGCGKSTLAKLAGGLYSPWEGEILFDGVPVSSIPRTVFVNSVATVSQDVRLFSGSIRDNLTMWDPTILEEDIRAAARDACIEDFILSRPGGYDYALSEGADNISGGEKQRLEIARALAKRPSVLILDEATSALDPLVEKEIIDNIRRRGCTCIMVAHRLSTIRDCGQILVMQEGAIVERGTHTSLMKAGGAYASLIREKTC